jgi:hypothetical protein
MTTRVVYVLRCTCGECGPDYLHRAERPEEPGHVAFPLLGVFDFDAADPVTFETKKIAEAVRVACVAADRSLTSRLVIENREMDADLVPGRLVGLERPRT